MPITVAQLSPVELFLHCTLPTKFDVHHGIESRHRLLIVGYSTSIHWHDLFVISLVVSVATAEKGTMLERERQEQLKVHVISHESLGKEMYFTRSGQKIVFGFPAGTCLVSNCSTYLARHPEKCLTVFDDMWLKLTYGTK